MQKYLLVVSVLFGLFASSQTIQEEIITKEIQVINNTITIDTLSISPYYLKLYYDNNEIQKNKYTVDFGTAKIVFNTKFFNNKIIVVKYKALPKFLTKTYKIFDDNLIVNNSKNEKRKYYQVPSNNTQQNVDIFEGIETSGFLSRGITVGNNQDGVVNSGLKLKLEGRLSSKIHINANITDNNVPLQDNGYTQRLNEYDRIFVELYSEKWKLTAGDLFLNNTKTNYSNFNKKVAGVSLNVNLKNKKSTINILNAGALVKSEFTTIDFNGQEANQGPYRIATDNNQFLLIIGGSETVYINGLPINKDNYTFDYSAAEITFKTTYPINSDMRIHIEFQASKQHYTRFVSFNKINYNRGSFNLEVSFFNESDSKSKPLQQDLNDQQKEKLFNAGDNISEMYTNSAIKESYIENKIQYKKVIINGVEIFEYSNNINDELYSVKYTYVGNNKGNYIIDNTIATGKVFKYIAPINQIKQGEYEPKIQLIAPNKLQITNIKGSFSSKNTEVSSSIAYSSFDKNLFSNKNDDDNTGFAGNLKWNQLLINKKWKLNSKTSYELINKDFNSIEKIKDINFNRDWNINELSTNQNLFNTSLIYENIDKGYLAYKFENLNLLNSFNGNKHELITKLSYKKHSINTDFSVMNGNSNKQRSKFLVLKTEINHRYKKDIIIGVKSLIEDNVITDKLINKTSNLSFKNQMYGTYIAIKDSTRTKLEVGFNYKSNDSVKSHIFKRVNNSNNYYLKSEVVKRKKSNLSVYINYRNFTNTQFNNDKSINSELDYRQELLDDLFQFKINYQTSSGNIPQQDYQYIEVDSGKGYYTWKDYNSDGIQDLDEFEIAQFSDEAIYVRVLLPSTKFIRTNQTIFNNTVIINPKKWISNKGFKKIIGHLMNQTNYIIDNKQLKKSNFQFNPFKTTNAVALQYNFKNSTFFNRGKQHYSITYSYLKSNNRVLYYTGSQENNIQSNQFKFTHKITDNILINLEAINTLNKTINQQYSSRNIDLNTFIINGKLSYFFNSNKSSINILYKYDNKKNSSTLNESLLGNNFGISVQHITSKKAILNASFNYINNQYFGSENSPISYQLLEGLQKGKNFLWTLVLQKQMTNYLDLNFNYNARKSENINIIHTGTVQLRAKF